MLHFVHARMASLPVSDDHGWLLDIAAGARVESVRAFTTQMFTKISSGPQITSFTFSRARYNCCFARLGVLVMLIKSILSLTQNALELCFVQSCALESTQLTVIHRLGSAARWTVVLLSLPIFKTTLTEYNFALHTFSRSFSWLLADAANEVLVEWLRNCVFFTRSIADGCSASSHLV